MLSISTGIAKKISQSQGHSLWNTVLHCFYRGLGESESQKMLLCQPFLVASFPWELRVSCALVIYNCIRAWWEPWPTSVSQKKKAWQAQLGTGCCPQSDLTGRTEEYCSQKRWDAFSHNLIFPRNNLSLLCSVNYCGKRDGAGGQTPLSFKVHLKSFKIQ